MSRTESNQMIESMIESALETAAHTVRTTQVIDEITRRTSVNVREARSILRKMQGERKLTIKHGLCSLPGEAIEEDGDPVVKTFEKLYAKLMNDVRTTRALAETVKEAIACLKK